MKPRRGTHHGVKQLGGLHPLCSPGVTRSDRFGRLLPEAPPLYIDPTRLALLGAASEPMQSNGPATKTNSVAVGQIFFGQFIDHDITLDLTSSFARLDRPEETANARTPALDLDCVYGAGADASAPTPQRKKTLPAPPMGAPSSVTRATMRTA